MIRPACVSTTRLALTHECQPRPHGSSNPNFLGLPLNAAKIPLVPAMLTPLWRVPRLRSAEAIGQPTATVLKPASRQQHSKDERGPVWLRYLTFSLKCPKLHGKGRITRLPNTQCFTMPLFPSRNLTKSPDPAIPTLWREFSVSSNIARKSECSRPMSAFGTACECSSCFKSTRPGLTLRTEGSTDRRLRIIPRARFDEHHQRHQLVRNGGVFSDLQCQASSV